MKNPVNKQYQEEAKAKLGKKYKKIARCFVNSVDGIQGEDYFTEDLKRSLPTFAENVGTKVGSWIGGKTGGFIAKKLGQGVVAVFGAFQKGKWMQAHCISE